MPGQHSTRRWPPSREAARSRGPGRPGGTESYGRDAPPDNAGGLGSLTPQELQGALIVARGSTNREAAAALFLSPKTVEFHLGNTYRKLGVRLRAELVRRVEGLT